MNRLNFYRGRLGNENWICSCNDFDLATAPNCGDLVYLPIDVTDYADGDMYVIKQRYVGDGEINYFCKPYDWED